MKYVLDSSIKNSLRQMCYKHGFVSRGETFFKIHTETILQVIGFQRECVFNHYSLKIGLMSMFQEADNDVFVRQSSLLNYSICCLNNCTSAVSLHMNNGLTTAYVQSPESQLHLLKEKGFGWLNSITTQEKLLNAINQLEHITYGTTIWNNYAKLAPYLSVGDFKSADYVIASILNQHLGPDSISSPPWTEEDFLNYSNCRPNNNENLLHIHRLIADKQEDAIKDYLGKNYLNNSKKAKTGFLASRIPKN